MEKQKIKTKKRRGGERRCGGRDGTRFSEENPMVMLGSLSGLVVFALFYLGISYTRGMALFEALFEFRMCLAGVPQSEHHGEGDRSTVFHFFLMTTFLLLLLFCASVILA